MKASAIKKEGVAAGVAGASLLAMLFAMRALGSATATSVILAGRELHWGCSFRQAFGIPCPACGMTRSVLLTLDGSLNDALALNPGGPLLVLGGLLLGAALLVFMFYQLSGRGAGASTERLQRKFILSTSAYGGLTAVVLLAHWVRVIV